MPRLPVDESLIRLLQLDPFPDAAFRDYLWDVVRMQNDTASLANFAAQVALVDHGVGQIVAAVDELGIAEDTLVVYTTDQANLFGQHGAWGHASSFVPTRLYDDLMRIPLVCRQPGTIPAGRLTNRLTGQYDIAPTLAQWASRDGELFAGSPGRSFADTLRGEREAKLPEAVWFEQEETRGVRTHRFAYWKRHQPLGAFWRELGLDWDGSPCLFDHAIDLHRRAATGREGGDADDRAVVPRENHRLAGGRLGGFERGDRRRHRIRVPELEERRLATPVDRRRGPVGDDHRAAVLVMAGDDPSGDVQLVHASERAAVGASSRSSQATIVGIVGPWPMWPPSKTLTALGSPWSRLR